MYLPEKEQEEFSAAIAAAIGWLERLGRGVQSEVLDGSATRGQIARRAKFAADALTDFYATMTREFEADDDDLDRELAAAGGPLRAEDFDHMPPYRGQPQL